MLAGIKKGSWLGMTAINPRDCIYAQGMQTAPDEYMVYCKLTKRICELEKSGDGCDMYEEAE